LFAVALNGVVVVRAEQDLWIELPENTILPAVHHAHTQLSQRVVNLAQTASSSLRIPASPLDNLAEAWKPCGAAVEDCRMGARPPPCAEREAFLQSRVLRNEKHAEAKRAVTALAEGRTRMTATFESASQNYQSIVDDPKYTTMAVNSPRWAAYNQLRLEAESAANGLQTLLLTAQATNKAYEAEEEAMQTAYGLTAECPVAPSKAAELANAMLTPGGQGALLTKLTAEEFWSCSEKRTIRSANQKLLGDLGTKLQVDDCSNWGFDSLSSCQVRCAGTEACGWALYDATARSGFCEQQGYCGMAKPEAASEAEEIWTGTSCVKRTGAQ